MGHTTVDVDALAAEVQRGNISIYDLWAVVDRLAAYYANKLLKRLPSYCGVEFDDLYQCGYPALVRAVDAWEQGRGTFTTYFILCLKTEIAQYTGYRTEKQRNDPLHFAVSLDAPVSDDNDTASIETLADESAALDVTEDSIYNAQLRAAIDTALMDLPPIQGEVIRKCELDGLAQSAAAREIGCTLKDVSTAKANALRALRRQFLKHTYRAFIEESTDYYLRVGSTRYQNTGLSAVEELAIRRERIEQQNRP